MLFLTPNYQPFCEPRGTFPAFESSEKLFGLKKGPENAQLSPESLLRNEHQREYWTTLKGWKSSLTFKYVSQIFYSYDNGS